jgi:hypothetical protein
VPHTRGASSSTCTPITAAVAGQAMPFFAALYDIERDAAVP